jgi:hypothetical protein
MEARINRRFTTLERATRFAKDHPVAVARVAILITALDAIIVQLYAHAGDQDFGRASFKSGSTIRSQKASELRDLLRSVNRIARVLDPTEFPGLKPRFLMPRGDGYERLRARASAFVDAAEPIKDAFIERGLDPDFIEQIIAKQDEMLEATNIKNSGLFTQVGGTAGLAALTRQGMRYLRELDAILTHQFRKDASLLAAWKSTAHVERDPQRNREPNDPGSNQPSPRATLLGADNPPDALHSVATATPGESEAPREGEAPAEPGTPVPK